jgi:hypothetical protein
LLRVKLIEHRGDARALLRFDGVHSASMHPSSIATRVVSAGIAAAELVSLCFVGFKP